MINADTLAEMRRKAASGLHEVSTPQALEQWRIAYIGRKGTVPLALRQMKQLPEAQRREIGAAANKLRRDLEELYKEKETSLKELAGNKDLKIENWKLEIGGSAPGHLHPLTLTIRRVQNILAGMGFLLAEGPEVEEARYNFDLLNVPLEHPARAETDTFYIDAQKSSLVLRTQTSTMQLRAVLENGLVPPFKIFSPGRVFRAERTDATHETTFYQVEGLEVGKRVSIADFKGVIQTFFSQFFAQDVAVRLRSSYFPFVEPGFEVDISCVFCVGRRPESTEALAKVDRGHQCRVCKNTRWIEVMGAGMVHPNVLKNMNINPAKYQGYAFGGAIDRLAMLRHGINDIRLFWSGNLQFLKQFS